MHLGRRGRVRLLPEIRRSGLRIHRARSVSRRRKRSQHLSLRVLRQRGGRLEHQTGRHVDSSRRHAFAPERGTGPLLRGPALRHREIDACELRQRARRKPQPPRALRRGQSRVPKPGHRGERSGEPEILHRRLQPRRLLRNLRQRGDPLPDFCEQERLAGRLHVGELVEHPGEHAWRRCRPAATRHALELRDDRRARRDARNPRASGVLRHRPAHRRRGQHRTRPAGATVRLESCAASPSQSRRPQRPAAQAPTPSSSTLRPSPQTSS